MDPPLVDYHCHLDLYPDYKAVFAHCRELSIETLAVTTTPRAWERNRELAADCPSVRVGLGMHPQLIAEGVDESRCLERLLPNTRYVGEVGLDAGPRYYKSIAEQKRIFERILCSCAEQKNKIISIHAVRAVHEVLTLVEKYLPADRGRAVLHWFTGSQAEAKRAAELGCHFSVNSQMLTNDSRRKLVRSLPISRILTETDGPFTIVKNRPATPADIVDTIMMLANVLECDPVSLRLQIGKNLGALEKCESM